jgi:hypothetical protein
VPAAESIQVLKFLTSSSGDSKLISGGGAGQGQTRA